MKAVRIIVAGMVTVVAGPLGAWAALAAGLTLLEQLLAGIGVITNAQLTQVLNPAVWIGVNNIAGTGSLLDSLVGGPGAPGGTMNRYFAFLVTAFVAAACYLAITSAWSWATRPRPR